MRRKPGKACCTAYTQERRMSGTSCRPSSMRSPRSRVGNSPLLIVLSTASSPVPQSRATSLTDSSSSCSAIPAHRSYPWCPRPTSCTTARALAVAQRATRLEEPRARTADSRDAGAGAATTSGGIMARLSGGTESWLSGMKLACAVCDHGSCPPSARAGPSAPCPTDQMRRSDSGGAETNRGEGSNRQMAMAALTYMTPDASTASARGGSSMLMICSMSRVSASQTHSV